MRKMKHNFKFYAAIACSAIALASCSSDAVEDVKTAGKQQMVFTAQQETGVGSRTSLGSDLSVLWSTGDVLSVLDGANNNDFTLTSGAGTASAEFTGRAVATSTYYAVYPYQSAASLSDNVISNVEIPTVQKATEGTFDPKAAIMTAVSDQSKNFQFKNVSSSARIITTAACKKITFTAGATDKIAGKFNMTVGADGIITASTATDATNTVTLVPSGGATSFPAGTYYISINPGTISSLKVKCEYTDITLCQSVYHSLSIFRRGTIINLGTASVEGGWKVHEPSHVYEYGKGKAEAVAVDLALPSRLKWASVNLGATSPEEYGDYYAWGATVPWLEEYHIDPETKWVRFCGDCKWNNEHERYNWVNAPYQTANTTDLGSTKWTKYLGSTSSSYKDPSATDENALKTVLDPEDDAATYQWGGKWRMPTIDDMKELIDNCYWVWTTDYNSTGIRGYIVYKAKNVTDKGEMVYYGSTPSAEYSLSDIHIFLPAAGEFNDYRFDGDYGIYRSSLLYESYPYNAYSLLFGSSYAYWNGSGRLSGRPVRAVCQFGLTCPNSIGQGNSSNWNNTKLEW